MHISTLARRTGVTVKAVRYYERLGLIEPERLPNGYRDYDESDERAVTEIRALADCGIGPTRVGPFIECLRAGHVHADDCPESLAAYRDSIAELDRTIVLLRERRASLRERLECGANRTFAEKESSMSVDYTVLPEGLPVPEDDGGATHLVGMAMPDISLPTSGGGLVEAGDLGPGRTVIYLYPLTGRPGTDLPEGWDSIPGARGCSTEACSFRDHFSDLQAAGAARVFGMSSQSPDYQDEVVQRLHLPFEMLSDEDFALGDALRLPVFRAAGHERLYARLTMIVNNNVIEHVFYPIFPPNEHAEQVLSWLRVNPS